MLLFLMEIENEEREYNKKRININIVITNLLGNLLMFMPMPMGMALPVLFDKKFKNFF